MPSEELEKGLRDEINSYLNLRLSALQEEITRLQSQVNEAFTRLLERSSDATQTDTSVAITISEHIRAAHERGIEEAAAESARTKASSEMALLKAAIDDIDDQRSQSDILSTLVNSAASFAPRIAFFVIKNERATGWRARGLEGTVGDEAIRDISLPLSADTLLSDVVRSRATWSGSPGHNADDHLLTSKLGGEPPQRMVAVPLAVRGRAVAVLYADSAALPSDAIKLEALEALVRVAKMAVELLSVTRPAPDTRPARIEQPAAATAAAPPSPATAAPSNDETDTTETTTETPAPVVAEAMQPAETETAQRSSSMYDQWNAAPPAVEQADAQQAEPAYDPDATLVREAVPVQPDYQTSSTTTTPAVETTTASPFASEQQQPSAPAADFVAPLGGTARRWGRDEALPIEVPEDEKRLHNDARRFARLLVSEIKLYNEQKVQEGRSQGDIYERLREDIDRSRQMYDKRVAPPVAARYDYFHQELVNTLAEGDAGKLGNDYPGASPSA
ncbi:MAG TPA: hypothetical protein VF528_01055 [Pyrinomonadaceae bacterium]